MADQNPDEIKEHKRIGHQLIIAMWILLLILIFFLFSDIIQQDNNPNQNVVFQETAAGEKVVSLKRNRYGHYITQGMINNHAVTFILDTGAMDIAIPEKVAQSLKLRRGAQSYYQTANGTTLGYQTRLDRVSIGNISLTNIRASIISKMPNDEILLGMSFLKHIEFSQRGDTLILRQ